MGVSRLWCCCLGLRQVSCEALAVNLAQKLCSKISIMAPCSRARQAVCIKSGLHAVCAGRLSAPVPDWGAFLTSEAEHGELRAPHTWHISNGMPGRHACSMAVQPSCSACLIYGAGRGELPSQAGKFCVTMPGWLTCFQWCTGSQASSELLPDWGTFSMSHQPGYQRTCTGK